MSKIETPLHNINWKIKVTREMVPRFKEWFLWYYRDNPTRLDVAWYTDETEVPFSWLLNKQCQLNPTWAWMEEFEAKKNTDYEVSEEEWLTRCYFPWVLHKLETASWQYRVKVTGGVLNHFREWFKETIANNEFDAQSIIANQFVYIQKITNFPKLEITWAWGSEPFAHGDWIDISISDWRELFWKPYFSKKASIEKFITECKEPIYIGKKFTPQRKSQGITLERSAEWANAKRTGKDYLYCIEYIADLDRLILSSTKGSTAGEFFATSDVIAWTPPKEFPDSQWISRDGLNEIHRIACPDWKNTIVEWAMQDPFASMIKLTGHQIKSAFKAATPDQLKVLKKWLKDPFDTSVDIRQQKPYRAGVQIKKTDDDFMLGPCFQGDFANKAFWLNTSKFDWSIKKHEGVHYLVPTKKI